MSLPSTSQERSEIHYKGINPEYDSAADVPHGKATHEARRWFAWALVRPGHGVETSERTTLSSQVAHSNARSSYLLLRLTIMPGRRRPSEPRHVPPRRVNCVGARPDELRLLQRRVTARRNLLRLAREWPAHDVLLDLLADAGGQVKLHLPLSERRARFEQLLAGAPTQLTLTHRPRTCGRCRTG